MKKSEIRRIVREEIQVIQESPEWDLTKIVRSRPDEKTKNKLKKAFSKMEKGTPAYGHIKKALEVWDDPYSGDPWEAHVEKAIDALSKKENIMKRSDIRKIVREEIKSIMEVTKDFEHKFDGVMGALHGKSIWLTPDTGKAGKLKPLIKNIKSEYGIKKFDRYEMDTVAIQLKNPPSGED